MDWHVWGPVIYSTLCSGIVAWAIVLFKRMSKRRDEETKERKERDKELNVTLQELKDAIAKLSSSLSMITQGCELKHQFIDDILKRHESELAKIRNGSRIKSD